MEKVILLVGLCAFISACSTNNSSDKNTNEPYMPLEERVIYVGAEYSSNETIRPNNGGEAVLEVVNLDEQKSDWYHSIVLNPPHGRRVNLIEADTAAFTWEDNRLIAKNSDGELYTFIRPASEKDTVVFKQTDELLSYLTPTVYEGSKAIVEITFHRLWGYEIVEPVSTILTFELNKGLIKKDSDWMRKDIRGQDTVWIKAGYSTAYHYSETPFPSDSATAAKRLDIPEGAIPLQIFR